MKSIRIIGGGLCGLSLGVALRGRGLPVRVDEAGSYPRHRVCGEFISGVAPSTLEALGIADVLAGVARHRSMRWYVGGKRVLDGRLSEAALGVSRFKLDEQLAKLFEELGGDLRCGSRCQEKGDTGVVWTTGRRRNEGQWVGLKQHVRDVELEADLEMHTTGRGYVGLAGVEAGRVNVCGLFHERVLKDFRGDDAFRELLTREFPGLSARLEEGMWDPRSRCAVAGVGFGNQAGRGGKALFLGDRDRVIAPFTGNGMSMAFESAEAAVDPLAAYGRGEMSWAEVVTEVEGVLSRRFSRRMRWSRFLHPFLTTEWGAMGLGVVARNLPLPLDRLEDFTRR